MAAARRKGDRPYHHGDLRAALVAAAEAELIEKGVDGFSLRSAARRAGVSHAAPAHHFRDTKALLDALAGAGFARLGDAMREEQAGAGAEAMARLAAAGAAYVRFALANPELFGLMYARSRRADAGGDLKRNSEAIFSLLVNAIGAIRGRDAFRSDAGWRDAVACWSMLHGYAQLAIAGKMEFATALEFKEQRPLIEELVGRALRERHS
ncbi:TetR/AcrR family transcriptional regulator [Oricola thermophila]|uniref:TetR/AcrR family transcriptional regulator n=1 Tax=Oricola thermophila TaxID=2742145 RepID=A0A6N1VHG2_9HYPH|nr:TetR-like C-terminal domain-containing protein [Oricola thermophila]QKV20330.1 TetR/AcrR family transcriptional regulator [Oricola thermophila]